MTNIFFSSDTHFGSERTLKYSCRPFKSTNEMDETIVNNWNNIVKSNDLVYFLGDIGNLDTFSRLNGNKLLVMGNYDSEHSDSDLKLVFDDIFPYPIETVVDGNLFALCHAPNEIHKEMLNQHFVLFGHIHEKCKCKKNGLNVGIDCHFFEPVPLDRVMFYKNAILNHYDNNVFHPGWEV